MSGGGVPTSFRWRVWGRYHRDARLLLLATLIGGAAISLWWIDFYLYLGAIGLSPATFGVVGTMAALAGGIVAVPASAGSDRIGRRAVFGLGLAACIVALGVLLLAGAALPIIILAAMLWSSGTNAFNVVVSPYLVEHSEPEHRNELFATQSAIANVTNVAAAILGAVVATFVAGWLGFDPEGPATYRILLVLMALLLVLGLVIVRLLTDDRPGTEAGARLRRVGEPAAFPPDPRRRRSRLGITIRDKRRATKILLPSFMISVGAGQVIPYLNVFIKHRFGLDLTELNAVFAVTSLGTVAAILFQPRLARRFGQISSVALVQAVSIPFLVVLGFSPVLWMVITAMAVRSSLMNAGNPIFNAFAMEHVDPAERASISAAMNVEWQLGWVIGGIWYSLGQALLGFDGGYAMNFAMVITLYTVATALTWWWFHRLDRRTVAAPAVA